MRDEGVRGRGGRESRFVGVCLATHLRELRGRRRRLPIHDNSNQLLDCTIQRDRGGAEVSGGVSTVAELRKQTNKRIRLDFVRYSPRSSSSPSSRRRATTARKHGSLRGGEGSISGRGERVWRPPVARVVLLGSTATTKNKARVFPFLHR